MHARTGRAVDVAAVGLIEKTPATANLASSAKRTGSRAGLRGSMLSSLQAQNQLRRRPSLRLGSLPSTSAGAW